MFSRILLNVVSWVEVCGQFSVEYEEAFKDTLVLVRTWDWDTFQRVCRVVLSKYIGGSSRNAAVLWQLLSVVVSSV